MQAAMEMRLAQLWRNFSRGQTQTVRTSCTLRLDDPERELGKPRFEIVELHRGKVQIEHAVRFGGKLFCHQCLSARDRFPVNVPLRLAPHVRAHAGEIVALSELPP